jgi:hypothetical protein
MSAGEQVADIKLPWWQQPSEFTAEKEISSPNARMGKQQCMELRDEATV